MIARTLPLVLALASLACRSGSSASESAGAAAGRAGEKQGVLAPLDGAVLSLWPEAYSGSWLVLEVAAQGTSVAEGDVVARLDPRAIDEELHRSELELASSDLAHQGLVERNRIETEAAQASLARARAALERARRGLAGWQQQELAFQRRSEELSRRYEDANVEDQTDELDQLEKMYSGDELVDATEDIVLKRARRGLSITQTQNQLARDRSKYRQELQVALEIEQRDDDVRAQAEAVERLERQQALDARARADAELRSADALALQSDKLARLRRDRALFELRAPRAGLLLHGAPRDYRPGKAPARHERGSQLEVRRDVFVVASPVPAEVAFDVSDAERARFASGAGIEVRRFGKDGEGDLGSSPGTVRLDDYPRSMSASETTLEASATLLRPLAVARAGERVSVRSAGSGS